jgi:hypothetical protein
MPKSLPLRAIADHFNDLDGIADHQERESRYQKLRTAVQQRLTVSDVAVSKGKTAEFGAEKAAQLRILQALMDAGFKGPVLASFVARLTEMPKVETAGNHPGTAIGMAVAGTRAGEDWILDVRVARHLETGEIAYLGGLRRADEERNPISDQILMAGRVLYATVTLPVSALIAPVLEMLDAD